MSERKTKVLTTPSGVEVVMKDYISAGEFLDLDEMTNDGAELSQKEKAKRLMLLAVVSVAGNAENIPDLLRELPIPDYVFLTQEVAKLVKGDFSEAKTPA